MCILGSCQELVRGALYHDKTLVTISVLVPSGRPVSLHPFLILCRKLELSVLAL